MTAINTHRVEEGALHWIKQNFVTGVREGDLASQEKRKRLSLIYCNLAGIVGDLVTLMHCDNVST